MKKRFLLCILISIFILPIRINALEVEYTLFDSSTVVNENRTADVTENYKIYFIKNTKEINRKLNHNIMMIREDDSKSLMNARVYDIKSDNLKSISSKNNIENILIKTDGKQDSISDYSLSYKYNFGKDTNNDIDEYYYDLVSNVDAPISNFTFSLTFPKKINKKNIKFSVDGKYDLSEDDVTYTVEDNSIVGSYNQLLKKGQTFSIYVELPNNYFKGATDNFNYLTYLILLIPIIGFVYIIYLWLKFGKGNSLKVKKQENIPNNFDPAEIGYLYGGILEEMDLTSLVIYLANQGYLKIVEHDDGYKLGKENSFKFVKMKDYDRNNAAQELIFNEIFREKDEVELSDIEYRFADTFKEAGHMLDNEDNRKKLYFENFKFKKMIAFILICLSTFLITLNPVHLMTNSYLLAIPMSLLTIFGLYVIFISNSSLLMKLVLGGSISLFTLYIGVTPSIVNSHLFIIYLIGVLLIVVMCILVCRLSERTLFGTKILGEIYGFKYYLESLTKNELEKKLEENNNYFFDMIPYAYVFDSLEVWIRKGKNLITTPPEWYIPSTEFNMINFEKFIKNVLYTTSLVMLKQVYSESELVTYENTQVKTKLND